MKIAINYVNSLSNFINKYFNKIELSIILIIIVLIFFHIIIQQIVFKKILDNCEYIVIYHQVAYKAIRYYSLKIITLIDLFPLLILAAYEFIKHSENFLKYSPFLGLIGVAITFALQEVVLSFAGWLGIFFGRFYFFG